MSIMKFAVCSMSSTASRSPPSVILGTLAVASPSDRICAALKHIVCLC